MAAIRKKVYTVGVNAGNDPNGNPRRGWMLYDKEGYFLGFVDEGYRGLGALQEVAPNRVELVSGLGVTVTYYRDLKKERLN